MSLVIKFYLIFSMLNMFRTLIRSPSGDCDVSIVKSKAPDDGCINVRNMLNIEEVK